MNTTINNFNWMGLTVDKNDNPIVIFEAADVIMTFPVTNAFEIHICNEFLRSLYTGLDVKFTSYRQYGELIMNCGLLLEKREAVTA